MLQTGVEEIPERPSQNDRSWTIAGTREGRRRPDSVAARVDALDVASFSTASSWASSRRRDGGRAGPPTAVNKAATVTGEWLVAMIGAVEQPVAADGAARLR